MGQTARWAVNGITPRDNVELRKHPGLPGTDTPEGAGEAFHAYSALPDHGVTCADCRSAEGRTVSDGRTVSEGRCAVFDGLYRAWRDAGGPWKTWAGAAPPPPQTPVATFRSTRIDPATETSSNSPDSSARR
ncbi:MAG TPA: hypothetical protein VK545_17795 [Streptomyces sp.]|nr:hypothetical protein [Streptomyces sp.]